MYIIGEEMSIVDSNANYVSAAFEKLDFFVVQDIFFSNTCRFADVVLPAAPSLEKEGTFTSTERRIQRLYQVFEPLEGCRPDWRIIQDVANALGAGWHYQHPSEVMDEIASVTPHVRRRELRAARGLQVTAVARCRRRDRRADVVYAALRDFRTGRRSSSPCRGWVRPISRTRSSICT